jgi:hypothetical protein
MDCCLCLEHSPIVGVDPPIKSRSPCPRSGHACSSPQSRATHSHVVTANTTACKTGFSNPTPTRPDPTRPDPTRPEPTQLGPTRTECQSDGEKQVNWSVVKFAVTPTESLRAVLLQRRDFTRFRPRASGCKVHTGFSTTHPNQCWSLVP